MQFATSTPPEPENRKAHDAHEAIEAARIARAEERLAFLRELTELGMSLARELARPTPEPASDESDPGPRSARSPRLDPAEAFARLSRANRLTLALEARTDEELSALRAGDAGATAGGARAAGPKGPGAPAPSADGDEEMDPYLHPLPQDYPSAHRNRVRDAVSQAINREVEDLSLANETLDNLYERLTQGERYDEWLYRPFREAVEAICRDLGLEPNWSDWTGEGWPPPPPGTPYRVWHRLWAPTRRPKPRLQ